MAAEMPSPQESIRRGASGLRFTSLIIGEGEGMFFARSSRIPSEGKSQAHAVVGATSAHKVSRERAAVMISASW